MEWLADPNAWVALATLTLLEIVLGVDNIIFITILVGRLPPRSRQRARIIGLGLAMLSRLGLLFSLAWLMTLTAPLFTLTGPFSGRAFSGRDLILIGGGLFLLWKSVHEIHNSLEGAGQSPDAPALAAASFAAVVTQIAIIDIVFSLDSVITAIGMVGELGVMVTAIVLAVLVMLFAARPIGTFVDRHPTLKMLALAFLILIGVALVCDGFGFHVPKGYIYFSMAFAVAVEMLNLWMRVRARSRAPVRLRKALGDEEERG